MDAHTNKMQQQQALHSATEPTLFASDGLRRRRKKDTSSRDFDEVDDRITIPLATSATNRLGYSNGLAHSHQHHAHKIGVSVRTSDAAAMPRKSASVLQSGLSKYRSLNSKSTTATTTTTSIPASSTTSSPTLVVPGASLHVPLHTTVDARGLHSRTHSHHNKLPSSSSSTLFTGAGRNSPRASTLSTAGSFGTGSFASTSSSAYEHALELVERKQFAAAIPFFTQALASSNSTSTNSALHHQSKLRLYFDRGNCYLHAQHFDKAIEDLTRVITLTPKNAAVFAKRAKAYASLNHHAAAIADFTEAIHLIDASTSLASMSLPHLIAQSSTYPTNTNRSEVRHLFLARARVFVAMRDARAALDDLARAENADGYRDPDVYFARAQILKNSGDRVQAIAAIDRFVELVDDELTTHDVGRRRRQSGRQGGGGSAHVAEMRERLRDVRFDRAALLLELAARADEQQQRDLQLLAVEMGDLEKEETGGEGTTTARSSGYSSTDAIALVERAIRDFTALLEDEEDDEDDAISSSRTELWLKRSAAYALVRRFDDALADVAIAQTLAPGDFEVCMARALLLEAQGQIDSAIAQVTSVLQTNGFFVDALFLRAKLLERQNELEKAQRDYSSIIDAHYDVRGETYSDAGLNSTTATEKTPLLGRNTTSSSSLSGANTGITGKQNGNTGKRIDKPNNVDSITSITNAPPRKIISQFSKRALLFRARLSVRLLQFDAAIADYERIQASFPNEIEPQLELPDARAKQAAHVEQERRDALASLLAHEDEEQERRDAAAKGSSTNKKKKKKKKHKKKKRTATPRAAGYVLLPDDDDDENENENESNNMDMYDENDNSNDTAEDANDEAIGVAIDNGKDDKKKDDDDDSSSDRVDGGDDEAIQQAVDSSSVVPPASPASTQAASASVVSAATTPLRSNNNNSRTTAFAAVTRDEACESMWETLDDDDENTAAEEEATHADEALEWSLSAALRPLQSPDDASANRTNDDSNGDDDVNKDDAIKHIASSADSSSSTATSATTAAAVVREVLVDTKYLAKRKRQLANLRSDLLDACATRDRIAIADVLERATRKQMTTSLAQEIATAQHVLASLDLHKKEDDDREEDDDAATSDKLTTGTTSTGTGSDVDDDDTSLIRSSNNTAAALTSDAASVVRVRASSASPTALQRSHRSSPRSHRDVDTNEPAPAGDGVQTNKPLASLVLRPIAYTHALQAAEQSQHQLQHAQQQLQAKDAEIAALRLELERVSKQQQPQQRHAIDRDTDAQPDDDDATDLASRLERLRRSFPHKELYAIEAQADALIRVLGPTAEADATRQRILAFVTRVLESALPLPSSSSVSVIPTGSYPMKTYLPSADLDVCLLLPRHLEPTWHLHVLQALALAGTSGAVAATPSIVPPPLSALHNSSVAVVPSSVDSITNGTGAINGSSPPHVKQQQQQQPPSVAAAATTAMLHRHLYASPAAPFASTHAVRNVTLIHADVRVIKCTIDNVAVDVTANRTGAIGALLLLDAMDAKVGKRHLLKRSLVLIKAWCLYESSTFLSDEDDASNAAGAMTRPQSVLGASDGAFTTYALNTIVLSLFNEYGSRITHPLQTLVLFLDRMATFAWHESALTLFGPVPLQTLAVGGSTSTVHKKNGSCHAKMSVEDVASVNSQVFATVGRTFDARLQPLPASQSSHAPTTATASASFPIRACNIVDPLDASNNLGRSVALERFGLLQQAFRRGRDQLTRVLTLPAHAAAAVNGDMAIQQQRMEAIDAFFRHTKRLFGRHDGWRPDLLVHPRQVWHPSKASSSIGKGGRGASRSKSSGQTAAAHQSEVPPSDDVRWQSLLPELGAWRVGATAAAMIATATSSSGSGSAALYPSHPPAHVYDPQQQQQQQQQQHVYDHLYEQQPPLHQGTLYYPMGYASAAVAQQQQHLHYQQHQQQHVAHHVHHVSNSPAHHSAAAAGSTTNAGTGVSPNGVGNGLGLTEPLAYHHASQQQQQHYQHHPYQQQQQQQQQQHQQQQPRRSFDGASSSSTKASPVKSMGAAQRQQQPQLHLSTVASPGRSSSTASRKLDASPSPAGAGASATSHHHSQR